MAVGFEAKIAFNIGWSTEQVDRDRRGPFKSKATREDYHFTTPERREEMRQIAEGEAAYHFQPMEGGSWMYAFGEYLHALQDSYSHEGFGPTMGQGWPPWTGSKPDKTYNDPKKADTMALATYLALLKVVPLLKLHPGNELKFP